MVCLGHSQVEIAAELGRASIIMGVNDSGLRHIRDGVIVLQHCLTRKYHILVEYGLMNEAALEPELLPVIGTAYIGGKKGLDAHFSQVLLGLYAAVLRIIKGTGKSLCHGAVLIRQLPGIGHDDRLPAGPPLVKGSRQVLDQPFIGRNRVVCHEYHDIRPAVARPPVSGGSMVKFLLGQMMHFQIADTLKALIIPVGLLCIHDNDFAYGIGLHGKHL